MTSHRRQSPEGARPGSAGRRRSVSASYAAKNFGALVGAVREERVAFVVERSGVPVVEVIPARGARATLSDLAAVYHGPDRLSEEYLREVERGVALLNRPAVPGDPWAS
jgi:hypothetical protein